MLVRERRGEVRLGLLIYNFFQVWTLYSRDSGVNKFFVSYSSRRYQYCSHLSPGSLV